MNPKTSTFNPKHKVTTFQRSTTSTFNPKHKLKSFNNTKRNLDDKHQLSTKVTSSPL